MSGSDGVTTTRRTSPQMAIAAVSPETADVESQPCVDEIGGRDDPPALESSQASPAEPAASVVNSQVSVLPRAICFRCWCTPRSN